MSERTFEAGFELAGSPAEHWDALVELQAREALPRLREMARVLGSKSDRGKKVASAVAALEGLASLPRPATPPPADRRSLPRPAEATVASDEGLPRPAGDPTSESDGEEAL